MKHRSLKYLLLIFIFLILGCSNVKPFVEKNNLKLSKATDTFEIPAFFYSEDASQKPIQVEGVEFIPHKLTYNFSDWNMSEPDQDGNVKITFKCNFSGDLEFYTSNNKIKWYYSYVFNSPYLFDYYTGEIYLYNIISPDNSTRVPTNGITSNDELNNLKYTEIKWNNKTTKVGVLETSTFDGWQGNAYVGEENGRKHYLTPISNHITFEISVPKDYDGLMLYIHKNPFTFEKQLTAYENKENLVKLQKEAQETGIKSEELIKLEEEKNKVSVFNFGDETKDDYYYINISDTLNIKHQTNNIYIVIAIITVIIIIAIISIIICKKRKIKNKK